MISQQDRKNISNLFPDTYYKLVSLSKEYVTYLVFDILSRSRIDRVLKVDFVSVDKIIQDLKLISEAKVPLEWMLSYLRDRDYLEEKNSNGISYFKMHSDLPDVAPGAILERMMKIDSNVLPSNLLLEKAARGYPDFLKGIRNGVDILFTDDKIKLWSRYFNNDNSGYAVYNSFATMGLIKWMPEMDGLRILEVGGGTGSASVCFLKEMHNKGLVNKIREYIFSDTSAIFLRVGNLAIMEKLPDIDMVQLKTLDFDRPLIEQGIEPDSIDVIFGVNSVHAAADLVGSLEYMYNLLKPGGMLILSECARPGRNRLLFQELIFNLLDNYRKAKLSELRPMPGFLDINSWERIFEMAGFKNVELLSNVDYDIEINLQHDAEVFAMIIKGEK